MTQKPLAIRFLIFISLLTMQGCVLSGNNAINTPASMMMHEYALYDAGVKRLIGIEQLAINLKHTDVIFVGEYHTHSASHRLQAELLPLMFQQNNNLQLSFEQFSRDKQSTLTQYINNEIGEQTLIKQADAWDNYQSDYRPLVEFARENNLKAIAANTPLSVVRCIARKGPDYIENFKEPQKKWIAKDIKSSSTAYQEKFMAAMSHHRAKTASSGPVKLSNSFFAQLARDNTMAESIYTALKQSKNSQVIHFNGAFHSNYHLGTVDALKRLDPNLKIAVISPQFYDNVIDWSVGDYVYTIKQLPTRYIKKENMNNAIKAMMEKRKTTHCEL
ncbi:ChaN family lipoprotein [Pseudoalteromonas luteoviolacea]|uniref:Haem-binding uptake Tiki superfamily ChaN domain-containing protein n=1 Tax=Pseudoalteromonas luteoviolacea S4054 TaxID=1129367 RepID=A0A0F6ADP3_9GAMM|nr:ChaN family lipoprotein [Pseudoalteromonas luteoviolacea]AOT08374.1 hypothetical protein S4054249_11185 [Pseudoalteromonas luteoviolacea]AOT13290.1 hypothetical protein S40542_11160 [Pseudoalteromonas luteoviolacea]AOT18203.1 hypothetical protein S4054_11160 [Pseudoalteromonas luteoviolacea]KKE84322.1 hypothetical protein N479_10505 [Pseudoalteromonas luteoviolacea S4054]KZN76073.1 hypothetical protein N481_06910 [Pseudoalteromonas luteoviolacea S4047-1]